MRLSFNLDFQRHKRVGFPEVVYGESKSLAQLAAIARLHERRHRPFLATRLAPEALERLPGVFVSGKAVADREARCLSWFPSGHRHPATRGLVNLVCAGTSDLPVLWEARATLRFLGARTRLIPDVGVAGIHRVLKVANQLRRADANIVAAGMEGALPSVVGGLTGRPVIAVPTSVGYGASFKGLAALLAMLTSCANGVVVVNIDGGFQAAMAAWRILQARR